MGIFRRKALRKLAAFWAVFAVSLLLLNAIVRLAGYTWEALQISLSVWQYFLLVLNVIGMAYFEGYRGFQQAFSPRFAARAKYIAEHGRPLEMLLAPVFCFGFFGSTRKRKIVAFVITAMIVSLVLLVGKLPQPWRGIVDAGVVVGLLWGLVSLWFYVLKAFFGESFSHSAELGPSQQLIKDTV